VGSPDHVDKTCGVTVRLAVITSGFPRISETFALNELLALRRRGMLAAVLATKPGDWTRVQPHVAALRDVVTVLPDGDVDRQTDAVVDGLAGSGVTALHGYFAHQPAAVAAAASARLGLPYGFTAHAFDIRKVHRDELAGRADRARGVVTCNRDTAAALASAGVDACLVPHGVDVARFAPRTASRTGGLLRVLGVGRLVEKRGFDVAIAAVALLGDAVSLRIVGAGVDESRLRREVAVRGLDAAVAFAGPRTHRELPHEYLGADVVVVPSVVDRQGDRDGLPNVVLEAMASGVAVLASDVAAVADAVEHDVTGLLVPPGEPRALASTLRRLQHDPALRRRLGEAARRFVVARYDLAACTETLCAHLGGLYG
jgi:glycosyltransferase involved in cell wall biosynthesis